MFVGRLLPELRVGEVSRRHRQIRGVESIPLAFVAMTNGTIVFVILCCHVFETPPQAFAGTSRIARASIGEDSWNVSLPGRSHPVVKENRQATNHDAVCAPDAMAVCVLNRGRTSSDGMHSTNHYFFF